MGGGLLFRPRYDLCPAGGYLALDGSCRDRGQLEGQLSLADPFGPGYQNGVLKVVPFQPNLDLLFGA